MKGIPLPPDAPLVVQVLFWILLLIIGLLFAGLIWFVKRYIDSNDKHHVAVDVQLKSQGEEFKKTTDRVLTLASTISQEAAKIDRASSEIRKMQADFQVQVNKELLEIHKATGQIKTDLTGTGSQVGLLKKDLEGLITTVEKHQHSLSLGAQAMVKQRDELGQVRSEIVRISEELVIIKGNKKQS